MSKLSFMKDCKLAFKIDNYEFKNLKSKILKKYKKEFHILSGYSSFSREVGKTLDKYIETKEKPALQFAMLRLHERAIKLYNEAFILLQHGSASGALARWRTLFEIQIVSLILNKYPDLSIKYVLYETVNYYKLMKRKYEYKDKLEFTDEYFTDFNKIKEDYEKLHQKYGWNGINSFEWAKNEDIKNPKLFELAKNLGLEYYYIYVDESHNYNHASAKYLLSDLGSSDIDGNDKNRYLFSPFELNLPILLIMSSLSQVNSSLIEAYSKIENADNLKLLAYRMLNNTFSEEILELKKNKKNLHT